MLRHVLLALLIALPFAGCLGEDDPAEPVAPAATAITPADPPNGTESINASVVEYVPVPISYSGTTPTGVCAFTLGQCQFSSPGKESNHAIDTGGRVVRHLAAQFTYGEQKPGMEFYVALCTGEGGTDCTDYTTGPSPYVVEYDLTGYAPGTPLVLSAGSVGGAAETAGAIVFAEVGFDVMGMLTAQK